MNTTITFWILLLGSLAFTNGLFLKKGTTPSPHRHLLGDLSEACQTDTAALFENNPDLREAFDALTFEISQYSHPYVCDTYDDTLECQIIVDRAMESDAVLEDTCEGIDGAKIHVVSSATLTCPGDSTTILRYLNTPDCVAVSCTESELQGAISSQLEVTGDIDEEVFGRGPPCTWELTTGDEGEDTGASSAASLGGLASSAGLFGMLATCAWNSMLL